MDYKVTREELYAEIWEKPISKVCKKYNVSDNAVRKKCIAFDIPMPNNAYWTNRRLGKQVEKKPLPGFEGKNEIVFQIIDRSFNINSKATKENEFYYFESAEKEKVVKTYNGLYVRTHLSSPHKYIEDHKIFLNMCVKNKIDLEHIFKGMFENIYRRPFGSPKINTNVKLIDTYSVSKDQINRAYLIYDCLIKAFEQCKFKVSVEKDYTEVNIRGESIQLRMREKYDKVAIKENSYGWIDYQYNPKGELVFMYKSSVDYNYCEIHETIKCPLEQKIKTIFKKICDKVECVKIKNKAWEEQHRLYEIEREKEEKINKIHDNEKTKVQDLIQKTKQFQLSQKIREYATRLKTETEEEILNYQWVMQKANWFDPTLNTEDKILNDRDKEELAKDKEITKNYW